MKVKQEEIEYLNTIESIQDIKVGDLVLTTCTSGHGSGGIEYNDADEVLRVTDKFIETLSEGKFNVQKEKWDRKTLMRIGCPTAYKLCAIVRRRT